MSSFVMVSDEGSYYASALNTALAKRDWLIYIDGNGQDFFFGY